MRSIQECIDLLEIYKAYKPNTIDLDKINSMEQYLLELAEIRDIKAEIKEMKQHDDL